jgi:hypothetical protein
VEHTGIDGEMMTMFFFIEIRDTRAIIHIPEPIHGMGFVQHGIGERCFSTGAMAHQSHRANVGCVILQHA